MHLCGGFPRPNHTKGLPRRDQRAPGEPFPSYDRRYAAPTTCFTSAKWQADSCAAGVSLPS